MKRMSFKTSARIYALCSTLWILSCLMDITMKRYGFAFIDIILGWLFGMIAIAHFQKSQNEDKK